MVGTFRRRKKNQESRWFLWHVPGMVVVSLAYIILISSEIVMLELVHSWLQFDFLACCHYAVIVILFNLTIYTHFKTMTTNPGTVPFNAQPLNDQAHQNGQLITTERFCDHCATFKPKRASHCFDCKRCIVMLDHHCPWINNCIGLANHKLFILFLVYVIITSFYTFSTILIRYLACQGSSCGFRTGSVPGRSGVIVLAASALFGVLTSMMLGLQLFSVYIDTTLSELYLALNIQASNSNTMIAKLGVLFGAHTINCTWLIPTQIKESRLSNDILLGYRNEDKCSSV